jgi:hypothetical protein
MAALDDGYHVSSPQWQLIFRMARPLIASTEAIQHLDELAVEGIAFYQAAH